MNTPSHFFINYAFARIAKLPQRYNVKMSAVVWGSLAPDIALYLLTLCAVIYYPLAHRWTIGQAMEYSFDTLFFENIVWISAHNLLQAPIVLLTGIALSIILLRTASMHNFRSTPTWRWTLVFFLSCFLHTLIDIFTHHDDGPLLLFPFNDTVRFFSPISYWDNSYYANIFFIFEVAINIACIIYLVVHFINARKQKIQETQSA